MRVGVALEKLIPFTDIQEGALAYSAGASSIPRPSENFGPEVLGFLSGR